MQKVKIFGKSQGVVTFALTFIFKVKHFLVMHLQETLDVPDIFASIRQTLAVELLFLLFSASTKRITLCVLLMILVFALVYVPLMSRFAHDTGIRFSLRTFNESFCS